MDDQAAPLALPLACTGKPLFILDARHGVEERYLRECLRGRGDTDAAADSSDCVVLPISAEGRALSLDRLDSMLAVDDDTPVIPVRVAWRIPHLEREHGLRLRDLVFGDPRRPGRVRAAWVVLRDRQRAHCLVGASATVGELRQHFASQVAGVERQERYAFARFVAREATVTLDIEERGIQGSRYKVPRFVADSILTSPEFRPALERIADSQGRPLADLLVESRRYLAELVSTPSPLWLDLRAHLDRFLFTRGYDRQTRFDPAELERLRESMRTHPTVLLFTHKTYIDASLPTLLLYSNDLPMLHTFGGINMDFAGFGALLRRSGAIFIRRSFQDNPVYKLVLRQYVAYLLEKRFPMSWALEGTRSRLGKLMPPRYGLLKYTLDAAHDAGIEGVHIYPFVTSFDLIRDVEEYAAEQTGRVKKPESLKWLLGYVRSLHRPMGRVRVDLGDPVVVRRAPAPDDKLGLAKIAFEVAVRANRVTPLTVTAVMCLILLGTAPRGATAQELVKLVAVLADWARTRGIRMTDELAADDRAAFLVNVDRLAASGLLLRYDEGSSVVYAIEPARHPIASYYRNSIAHHFLDKSILELALFKVDDVADGDVGTVFWAETERLRELFKFEFFYPPREEFRAGLVAELERVDPRWRERLAGDRLQARRLSRRLQPFIGHAVLLPYVEAYAVVVDLLARLGHGERLEQQRCVELALKEGRQAYLLRRVSSEASIGRILFENGFRLAAHLGLAGESTDEAIAGRRALLWELRALSHRMERMRHEALARAEEIMAMKA
ncbi:MAG: glycerol-3-phosphate 1-O-acyltransferase [Steroidobacteraceae bacterium]